jgi:hypothetical protein
MTRGPPPVAAIRDAKKFAKKMGYFVQENTDNPELGYDFIASRSTYAMLVKVRVVRYTINPEVFYEDMLADELRDLRGLPFPPWMPREIWLRTQHERTFRRLRVYDVAVGELGFWTPDEYVNPHAR